jgi:hypothetical protein
LPWDSRGWRGSGWLDKASSDWMEALDADDRALGLGVPSQVADRLQIRRAMIEYKVAYLAGRFDEALDALDRSDPWPVEAASGEFHLERGRLKDSAEELSNARRSVESSRRRGEGDITDEELARFERATAWVECLLLADTGGDSGEAERLAKFAAGDGKSFGDYLVLAYVRARFCLPGAAESIMSMVTIDPHDEDTEAVLLMSSPDGRTWREELGVDD